MLTINHKRYREKMTDVKLDVDFSKVHRDDRLMVNEILTHIMTYKLPMPKLKTFIYDIDSHYNVLIRGWAQDIDLETFYNRYLGPKRDQCLDALTSIIWRPMDVEGGEGGLCLKIQSTSYNGGKSVH